jgi:hypothetical protein
MKRHGLAVSFALAAAVALLLSLVLGGNVYERAHARPPEDVPPIQWVFGDAELVDGNLVVSWARVHAWNGVKEVGVTIPVAVFDEMPEEDGPGPHGAYATLAFPDIVQETTYFNHVELHSNPHGHDTPPGSVNPIRNSVPHFDFHYYAIPEEAVWLIPASTVPPPLLPRVAPERLPAGYTQPGRSIVEMGRHSSPIWSLFDPDFLSTITLAGFLPDATQMHFIEPMVSRERLLERTDFELPVPMPAEFGRLMRYPTKFVADYDADLDAYHFVYSEFVPVE